MNRYLIIRFSSFGDIMQALPVASCLRANDPTSEIHWLTRQDFAQVLKRHRALDGVWPLARQEGLAGLARIAQEICDEDITHIYDAHSNVRSTIICLLLRFLYLIRFKKQFRLVRRSKDRVKRILLFRFGKNLFPQPFRGALSYLAPLKTWFENVELPPLAVGDGGVLNLDNDPLALPEELRGKSPLTFENSIALAPGATWGLKKWPDEHWFELLTKTPKQNYILLGGPEDKICAELQARAPDRVINLAGRLSWVQSLLVLRLTRGLVAADTGLMHAADILGKPLLALMGPTAFGFPSRGSSVVLEVALSCRPCTKDGRGGCTNSQFKRCMVEITPAKVAEQLRHLSPPNDF